MCARRQRPRIGGIASPGGHPSAASLSATVSYRRAPHAVCERTSRLVGAEHALQVDQRRPRLVALRDRRVDLMATVGYEPTREAFMAYTLGTAPNPGAIIGRASDGRYAASATLDGHRVALERGSVLRGKEQARREMGGRLW